MRIPLALLAVALGFIAFLEWWSGEGQMARYLTIAETPPPKPPQLHQAPNLVLSPEPHYAEIVQRTLFRPERRPVPVDDGATPDAAPEALDLKTVFLTAISMRKSGQFALWYDSADHKTWRVKVGDKLKNYTVQAIRADALVLTGGGREETLPLRDYKNRPPAPQPPARMPVPAKPQPQPPQPPQQSQQPQQPQRPPMPTPPISLPPPPFPAGAPVSR